MFKSTQHVTYLYSVHPCYSRVTVWTGALGVRLKVGGGGGARFWYGSRKCKGSKKMFKRTQHHRTKVGSDKGL